MLRLILLSILVVAGLLGIPIWQNAGAAPLPTAVQQGVASIGNGLMLNVYYRYHGRNYKYRYKGHYYNHRSYRSGRWHYY